MAMNNLFGQIQDIDVTKGYGDNNTVTLADGTYYGVCEDFTFFDKGENGGLFVIKIKTTAGDSYPYFININAKTFKFNMKNLLVSLYYISQIEKDFNALQPEILNNPEGFVFDIKDDLLGKSCTFTLKTNKNNFQSCTIEKPESYPF